MHRIYAGPMLDQTLHLRVQLDLTSLRPLHASDAYLRTKKFHIDYNFKLDTIFPENFEFNEYKAASVPTEQTQDICITFAQRLPNVFDV